MTNDPIEADPDGMRRAAHLFEAVSTRTNRILTNLEGGSPGEPWGQDDIGTKFADGDGDPEKGYRRGRDNMFSSVRALVGVLDENAVQLADGANQLEQADES
ncbi:hypothetical protein [Nocardia sp. NPDC057227]|uniref:hypothetical protein n=1 Tax=Nocardia sp. NPDC057227 TaxID=3346056 RepID=UPI0036433798